MDTSNIEHRTSNIAANYLDPQTLASVSSLELRARMIVEGLMTGMHRSPYFGYSVEFAQHRQYAPGDDIRHLDWKVFGRTDKLYLKQFQKETNLDLVVLVDASGSMGYSSGTVKGWTKYDHAATLAATLAYLALRQQDRVGLVLFTSNMNTVVRRSNARDHWRAIVEALGSADFEDDARFADPRNTRGPEGADGNKERALADRATDLGRLFDQVTAKLNNRSLIVLISDLFDDPESLEHGLARVHFRRHDLFVLQTLDHAELTFPFRSSSEFFGLEGEGRLPLDPAALRQAYLDVMREHLDAVEQTTRRFGFDHMLLDTSKPLGAPLSQFLARRAAFVEKKRS
jgi:uncharacterized protein (DUF58 family)